MDNRIKPKINFFTRGIVIFLIVTIVVVFSGVGVLIQPKQADALWPSDWTAEYFHELLNETALNVHDFVIFPMVVQLVIRAADQASDMPMWANSLDSLGNYLIDAAIAEAINTFLGINICGDLSIHLKLVLFDYAVPDWAPECTWSMAQENFRDMRESGFENFALGSQTGGDFGVWYGMYGDAIDTKARWEKGILHQLTAGLGFSGITTCPPGEIDPLKCQSVVPGSIMQKIMGILYSYNWEAMFNRKTPMAKRYMLIGTNAISVFFMSVVNKGIKWLVTKTYEERQKARE